MERMEKEGIVGAANHAGKREILGASAQGGRIAAPTLQPTVASLALALVPALIQSSCWMRWAAKPAALRCPLFEFGGALAGRFRDAHAVNSHLAFNFDAAGTNYGRVALGLPTAWTGATAAPRHGARPR